MMPEEWPIAASAADGDARVRVAQRDRLSTVRRDFFLDPAQRLTEQERALMTAMLHCLVGDIAASMRAALPRGRLAANDADDARLIARLSGCGLLDQQDLMALLLRRADEERIASAARARCAGREARVLQGLVSSEHAQVAAAAMALILGRGRRRDRFGQCLVAFDDVGPLAAETLVHAIAAALRDELVAGGSRANADFELGEAASLVLGRRSPERAIDTLTSMLVEALENERLANDELVLSAAKEGEITFVAVILARRAALPTDSAIDELLSAEASRIMILLRAAHASDALATGLLAQIGDLLGVDDVGAAMSAFESFTDGQVGDARAWLSTARGYRTALERLAPAHG